MDLKQLDAIAYRKTTCHPFGETVSISRAERDELVALAMDGMQAPAMRGALKRIVAIEDKMFGGDWEEIEEARNIARAVLAEIGKNMEKTDG